MRLSYRTGMGIHQERERQFLAARDEVQLRRLAREASGAQPRIDLVEALHRFKSTVGSLDVRDRVRSAANDLTRGHRTTLRHR